MKSSLIFTAAGIPLAFDHDYDPEYHWRLTTANRLYQTHVTCYNNFQFDINTYDTISYSKGTFCQLAKQHFRNVDLSQYEYIGFFADDVITDSHNINRALQTAYNNNIKAFTISFNQKNPCRAPNGINFTQKAGINFLPNQELEILGTFLHASIAHIFFELINFYDCVIGWGLDVILGTVLKTQPYVIHNASVLHNQYGPSHYKYDQANNEFIHLMDNVFYEFMEYKYNEVIDRNIPLPWKPYQGSFFNFINNQRKKIKMVEHREYGPGKIMRDSIVEDSRGMWIRCDINYTNCIERNVLYSDIEMDKLIGHNPKYTNILVKKAVKQ